MFKAHRAEWGKELGRAFAYLLSSHVIIQQIFIEHLPWRHCCMEIINPLQDLNDVRTNRE